MTTVPRSSESIPAVVEMLEGAGRDLETDAESLGEAPRMEGAHGFRVVAVLSGEMGGQGRNW